MDIIYIILVILIIIILVKYYIHSEKKVILEHKMTFLTLKLIKDKFIWDSNKKDLKRFLSLYYKVTINLNYSDKSVSKDFGKRIFLNQEKESKLSDKIDDSEYISQLKEFTFINDIQDLSIKYYVETISRFKTIINTIIQNEEEKTDMELENLIFYYTFFHNEFTKRTYQEILSQTGEEERSKLKLKINGGLEKIK